MIKYKYKVFYSKKFKKNLKKMLKQGKNIEKLLDVVDKLALKEELNEKYKNHMLKDDKYYKNCGECHIQPDWLLVYQYYEGELILVLVNTGSHSDLFRQQKNVKIHNVFLLKLSEIYSNANVFFFKKNVI